MLRSVRLYINLQGKYLRPHWKLVLLLAVLLFSSTGLLVLTPQLVRHFIDVAYGQGALASLYLAAVVFLGAGLGYQLLRAATMYVGRDVAWRATNRLRADLTLHVLRLDMGFHNAHTPGDLLERIDGDIERLANFFSQFFIHLVGAFLLLAVLIVVTWLEDWRFGLALAGFAAFFMVTRARLLKFILPFWNTESEARADIFGFIGERLGGVRDIQKSGAISFTMAGFYRVLRRKLLSWVKAGIVSSLAWGVVSGVNSMRYALWLGVGGYLFQRGDITIGTVYLGYHYLQMMWLPINWISNQFQDLQKASVSISRTKELMDTASTVQDGPGARLPPGRPAVEFADVSFSYKPGVKVLHQVSFDLQPGRSLALLGRTGAGKTTISRLLFRFYDPEQGSVRLSGVDLRDTKIRELRDRVGMVTQEVQLFHATLRDNLTLFDDDISDEKIIESLESLGLGRWLSSLAQGLDTEMQAGGGQLSAGEAQLLAFARVFLRDPDLVVLDEATSRLDPATERLIEDAVQRLLEGRTVIVIAHQLSTVRRVDEVMIIDDGRVQERGERKALAEDPSSRFAALLRTGLEEVLA